MERIITKGYRRVLNFALARPFIVVAIAVLSFVGSFVLFPQVGISFFPNADKPLLLIDVDMPKGTSLERTNEAALYVESVLDSVDYVENYTSNIGHGNPQVYYNIIPENFKKNYAQVLVNLEEWNTQRFYSLLRDLRKEFAQYPGGKIKVIELKNGPPYAAPIEIKLIGDHLDTLRSLSRQVEAMIAGIPGTINVNNPLSISKTDLKVNIHQDKAGLYGVQLADIDLAVRTALTGTPIGVMNTSDGEEFDMVLRMAYEEEPGINDFEKIAVASVTGAQVPLKQLAGLEFQASASKIDHFDLQRNVGVTADVLDSYNSRDLTLQIIEELENMEFPTGYTYYVGGEFETQQESFGDLGQMLIVAILGIFAILILQFKSFRQPFIVLSAIPLAFSGSILALYLTGWSFSFFAFVGFTSLVGIVVNTSIILVDYTNQLVASGMSSAEALRKGQKPGLRPLY